MAVFKIVLYGDEVLREKARPVAKITPNIHKLLDNMRDTMYHARGVGLAAPQIGVSKRVIVVDTGEGLIELINPEIVEARGEETDTEGCLSLPNVVGEVTRATEVRVKGLDRHGNPVEHHARGFLARALQHEIDHLDGILFIDRAVRIRRVKPGA
ncbi:peptide deformylase [Desulfofundulus salinus]|uniref:Peptide deformylase n=1 Tax=Desulfofundulus salinus TaxID=2419843 RepID=A0A494X370_9FIRM|nr:peptide deformylase [Desulfofundulus salinum]RKO67294.1 peptide deformylase [Desulfofundulus salinum]